MDKATYWSDLQENFLQHIVTNTQLGEDSIKKHRTAMKRLLQFAMENELSEYSPEVGMAFFEAERQSGSSIITLEYRRACIRKLNLYLFGDTFWQRSPRDLFKYQRHICDGASRECPIQFLDGYTDFISQLEREGLQPSTIDYYRVSCTAILRHFDSLGITRWEEVNAQALIDMFDKTKNKHHFINHAKRLFRYLAENTYITENYAEILPRMRKKKTVPSVYTHEEIEQLLDSIERFTPQGKRDYAIVLLILRTGLRQSDVRELRFENVDFGLSRISIIQYKTGIPLTITIAEDAKEALIDYLANGRERSVSDQMFLNGYGQPMTKGAVSHIVSRHIKSAGINPGKRHAGSHALRMTFASQLVEEKMPYEVVKTLLGHASAESTTHYVEFSTEGLRACALDVPMPTSAFLSYLQGGF